MFFIIRPHVLPHFFTLEIRKDDTLSSGSGLGIRQCEQHVCGRWQSSAHMAYYDHAFQYFVKTWFFSSWGCCCYSLHCYVTASNISCYTQQFLSSFFVLLLSPRAMEVKGLIRTRSHDRWSGVDY